MSMRLQTILFKPSVACALVTCVLAACSKDVTIADLSSPDSGQVGDRLCGGEIAERVFSFSACSCEGLELIGSLQTVATGPGQGEGGAGVGVNAALSYVGDFDVDGSLEVGGSDLSFSGTAAVHGDLAVAGSVTYAGTLAVSRHLRSEDRVIGIGTLNVGGEQTLGEVLPPCDCSNGTLNIPEVVAAARIDNDNEDLGIDSGAFMALDGEQELLVSGGHIYLVGVAGSGKLRLVADQPTSIFVDGDVNNTGSLETVIVGDGALDVFVAGDLSFGPSAAFVATQDVAKVRFYVEGEDEIVFAEPTVLAANLYAPHARVSAAGTLEVHGSLFARDIALAGDLIVRHDRGVQSAGQECPAHDPADHACQSSIECATTMVCAASAMCSGCQADENCKGAQVCVNAACQPLTF